MTRLHQSVVALFIVAAASVAEAQSVRLVPNMERTRVDVEIDGKLFTSYRWDEKISRPVLFPVMSASGNFITRGFPIETRDNETVDHPHQVGCSFSHGNVNGIDFWNNSPYRTEKELGHMGRIVHKKILGTKNGVRRGELVTASDWLDPKGAVILNETTRYVFHADARRRWIDRETTLTAAGGDVEFGDSKEGSFAIHLSSELEQDDQTGVRITSAAGAISQRTSKDGLTGKYTNSEGLSGNAVWGTTGRWAAVAGRLGTEAITVAMFDSPKNANSRPYMMVRGYGLLALNPFGQRSFVPEKAERRFKLAAGKSVTFRYRLLLLPGSADRAGIEIEYRRFAGN